MSEWRHRGFVEDSEQEDHETLSSSSRQASPTTLLEIDLADSSGVAAPQYGSVQSSSLPKDSSPGKQHGDHFEEGPPGAGSASNANEQPAFLGPAIQATVSSREDGEKRSCSRAEEEEIPRRVPTNRTQDEQRVASAERPNGASLASISRPSARSVPLLEIPIIEVEPEPQHRNLRRRTLVQLHPYLFDMQNHKEQMRARGLKPIKVVVSEERGDQDDEANLQGPQSSQEPSSTAAPGSPMNSQLMGESPSESPPTFRDDDDLPDVDALFQRRLEGGIHLGFKRRKTQVRIFVDSGAPSPSIFDIPPSPFSSAPSSSSSNFAPLSQGVQGPDQQPVFHVPKEISPSCFPTPATSSDLRSSSKPIEVFSDSDMAPRSHLRLENPPRLRSSRASISSPSSQTSESESDKNVQVRRVQKRIKGVLPASWLRLDQRAQEMRAKPIPTSERISPSPTTSPVVGRGIAQIKRMRRAQSLITTEEDQQVGEDLSPAPISPLPGDIEEDLLPAPISALPDDIEEEDFIDPMLTRTPKGRTARQHRKMQLKLPFKTLARPPEFETCRRHRDTPVHHSLPRLSILDATVLQHTTTIPRFVKIAARKVCKRDDRGRHCPKRKIIQLHTRHDTEDAQATLRRWREGTIKQASLPKRQRKPLAERTANNQSIKPFDSVKVPFLKSCKTDLQCSGHSTTPGLQGGPKHTYREPRKREPQRLDIERLEYQQFDDTAISVLDDELDNNNTSSNHILQGFSPFGTRYTLTFDVDPLQPGTSFHESSFVGSGGLQKAINATLRDINTPAGFTVIHCASESFRWGPYTEDVASELEIAFRLIQDDLASQKRQSMFATQILRSISKYYAESLSFLDPVDARNFVAKSMKLCEELLEVLAAASRSEQYLPDLSLLLVLSDQTYQVALYQDVNISDQEDLRRLVCRVSESIINFAVVQDAAIIHGFLEKNKRLAVREAGIRVEDYQVEALVVAAHILNQPRHEENRFWVVLDGLLMRLLPDSFDNINVLEKIWEKIFVIQPLLDIDDSGVLGVGQQYNQPMEENWNIIRRMLDLLFKVYSSSSCQRRSSIFNEYFRANLARCHHLIQEWGWGRCESIVGCLFDFFAQNRLAHLRNEKRPGSPRFLNGLKTSTVLKVNSEDRSFCIFLKIIGTGMRAMAHVYSERKIQSIAWRMIPNHGRTYFKEQAIRQEDLEALRNHHDLLCTLYWACPPACRPRLQLFRNLVDHVASHREACLVNIRAWTTLARFQISLDEPASFLLPFADWFNDILGQTMSQHKLAKTEAEEQYEVNKASGSALITDHFVYTTISKNQRQVEAALSDALLSLKDVLKGSWNAEAAGTLLGALHITDVFRMLDPKTIRLNKVICHALDVFTPCFQQFTRKRTVEIKPHDSEESQDFGDFSALEDAAAPEDAPKQSLMRTVLERLSEPLSQLLSSCVGSEISPDETLLIKVIDSWVLLASLFVEDGRRSWANYIDSYSSVSWQQLLDTEQKRKYGVYFMAAILAQEKCGYSENASVFLEQLCSSLVERESMLKYQHLLLQSILNADPGNCVLSNLPYRSATRTGLYGISLAEVRQRRLGTISCILANMRESFDYVMYHIPAGLIKLRQEYTTLLKHLMAAMKRNYEELGQGSDVVGAYVGFVQKVVEFLQQHTADICPVDRFFTDSAAFPLPANDPTYVVGRLKSYIPKLADPRQQKELAIFVQTAIERAAVDGSQPNLVAQLHAATQNSFETGDSMTPTLRRVLLEGMLPAYIRHAFNYPCGWVIARPILQASALMFEDVMYDMSTTDSASTGSVMQMIMSVLAALQDATGLLTQQRGLLDEVGIVAVLTEIVRTITAVLPLVDYIYRSSQCAFAAVALISYFRSLAVFIAAATVGHADVPVPEHVQVDVEPGRQASALAALREYYSKELQQSLRRAWVRHGDEYYLLRGSMRKEVVVHLENAETEKSALLRAIERFFAALERAPAFTHLTDGTSATALLEDVEI